MVSESGNLLDYLLKNVNKPRNTLKHFLSNRLILVNKVVQTKFNYQVKPGDIIEIDTVPLKSKQIENFFDRFITSPLYSDDYFIVVNKPTNILVDGDEKSILPQINAFLKTRGHNEKAYLLHRLDKRTSGVLMFAKSNELVNVLQNNWNELVSERKYYAITETKLLQDEGEFQDLLFEKSDGTVLVSNRGKLAITKYKLIAEKNGYFLYDVLILSGRKNQIRVQFSYHGSSLVGDSRYYGKRTDFHRLGLHCYHTKVRNPLNNQDYEFKTKMPKEFRTFFN